MAGEQAVRIESVGKARKMDQGLGLMTAYSLFRVAKGFFVAIAIGTPLGFLLGSSTLFILVL